MQTPRLIATREVLQTALSVEFPDGFRRDYVCPPADGTGEWFTEPDGLDADLAAHCPQDDVEPHDWSIVAEAICNQANASYSKTGEWHGVRWTVHNPSRS